MAVQVELKLTDDLTVRVTGEKGEDIIKQLGEWSEIARIGDHCQGAGFLLVHRRTQSPKGPCDYFEVVCKKCGYEHKLSMRRDDHKLFPKGEWQPPYQRQGGQGGQPQQGYQGGQPQQGYQQPQQYGQPQQGYQVPTQGGPPPQQWEGEANW